MRFCAILNKDGGTLRTMDLDAFVRQLESALVAAGHEVECHVVGSGAVRGELEKAAADPNVDALIAGGGDGTISSAAAVAFATGKSLAVLPAGTMNLFARALGMPLDLSAAVLDISNGRVRNVDIATANGRPFVHQFGVGVHARLVRIRNDMVFRSRIGKMLASLRAIGAAAINPPRFEVELHTPVGKVDEFVSGIAISNNPLDNAPVPVAARLDSGLFGVYVAKSVNTNELLNLVLDVVAGRWRNNARVVEYEVDELTLRFPKRKRGTHAVIDGELIALETVVQFKMHPGGLSVVGGRA